MKKLILGTVCAALSLTASAALTLPAKYANRTPFAHAAKCKYTSVVDDFRAMDIANGAKKRNAKIAKEYPGLDTYGFIEMPDGTYGFYTVVYDETVINHESEYENYTERIVNGYTITVYDRQYNKLGEITDKITLRDGETKLASLMVCPVLTRKFFNVDDNYELAVSWAMNTTEYSIAYHTRAYGLASTLNDNGVNDCIAEVEGYLIDYVNAPVSQWGEGYFMAFLTEYADTDAPTFEDLLESYENRIAVYKKSGWTGGPQLVHNWNAKIERMAGDQQSVPFFYSFARDGVAYFIEQEYEKWFFVDPTGMNGDESAYKDNNLIIKAYKCPSTTSGKFEPVDEVKIAASQDDGDAFYTFWSTGNLDYDRDVVINAEGTAIDRISITKQVYTISSDEDYIESYYHYDRNGKCVKTLLENTSAGTYINDLAGADPQMLFVTNDANGNAQFSFLNTNTGDIDLNMPATLDGNALTTLMVRYGLPNAYHYVCQSGNTVFDDNDNLISDILWINTQGNIDRIDKVNLGQNIAVAYPYINSAALNPFLFDTSDANEYMYLVKRYTGVSTTTREELVLTNPAGDNLLTLSSDLLRGTLLEISPVNLTTDSPKLMVVYRDKNWKVTPTFYDLPLVKFAAGGTGTAADPYLISSVGDLQEMSTNLRAHYRLACNIDGSDYTFKPINADAFTGSLDGAGYTISNLNVEGEGIFGNLAGTVKDINFVNATCAPSKSANGLVAGYCMTGTISNVHVLGLTVNSGDETIFGGIVGKASNTAAISGCRVANARIDMPKGASVGGIAGALMTGAKVSGCAVTGTINAYTEVGGIAGTSVTGDETIADCHVNATITARHTVGGVLGFSKRTHINRCHVEGSIEATGIAGDRFDKGPRAGGIVGYLLEYSEDGNGLTEADNSVIIAQNLVQLASLKGYTPTGTGNTYDTMHRIVGYTSANMVAEEDNPAFEEAYIADNYAVTPLEATGKKEATSVEGADVDASAITNDWLSANLGFVFGTSLTEPWHSQAGTTPKLHFEVDVTLTPAALTMDVNSKATVHVVFVDNKTLTEDEAYDRLTLDGDLDRVDVTDVAYADNALTLTLTSGDTEGEANLTICGCPVKITVKKGAGVGDITVDLPADTDAAPVYYNLQGARLAAPVAGQIVIERRGNTARKIIIH